MKDTVKMKRDDFESTVKGIVEHIVSPIVEKMNEDQSVVLDAYKKEVDVKITELVEKESKLRIAVGEDELGKDKKSGFQNISHFAKDLYEVAATGGRKISKELEKWEDRVDTVRKAAGTPSGNISDAEAGGYLVPPEFRQEVLVATREKNELLTLAKHIPMATQLVEVPFVNGFDKSGGLVYGNVQWTWTDEEAAYTAKNVKLGKIQLKLNKLTGLTYASEEILKFSPISMENLLQEGFADGLNFEFNRMVLKGTGAGQPLGLLYAPCKEAQAKETGQANTTIVWENIIKMYSRVSNMEKAVWIANPDTLPQLTSMSLAVGTGGVPVFMPANGASGRPYNTLMGLPIVFSHHCKTVGTEGDILLSDMSQYLVGMPASDTGTSFDTSMHLKFDYGQTAYKWTMYMDGQPWWKSSLTPPESSTTISPIISLASRP